MITIEDKIRQKFLIYSLYLFLIYDYFKLLTETKVHKTWISITRIYSGSGMDKNYVVKFNAKLSPIQILIYIKSFKSKISFYQVMKHHFYECKKPKK